MSKKSETSENMRICLRVKTLDQRLFSISVASGSSVPQLKQVIASETGVVSGRQRLIFRGKVLKNEENLTKYALEDGHTIHLVVRPEVSSSSSSTSSSSTPSATTPTTTTSSPPDWRGIFNTGTTTPLGGRVLMGATITVPEGSDINMPFISTLISTLVNSVQSSSANSGSSTTDTATRPVDASPSNSNIDVEIRNIADARSRRVQRTRNLLAHTQNTTTSSSSMASSSSSSTSVTSSSSVEPLSGTNSYRISPTLNATTRQNVRRATAQSAARLGLLSSTLPGNSRGVSQLLRSINRNLDGLSSLPAAETTIANNNNGISSYNNSITEYLAVIARASEHIRRIPDILSNMPGNNNSSNTSSNIHNDDNCLRMIRLLHQIGEISLVLYRSGCRLLIPRSVGENLPSTDSSSTNSSNSDSAMRAPHNLASILNIPMLPTALPTLPTSSGTSRDNRNPRIEREFVRHRRRRGSENRSTLNVNNLHIPAITFSQLFDPVGSSSVSGTASRTNSSDNISNSNNSRPTDVVFDVTVLVESLFQKFSCDDLFGLLANEAEKIQSVLTNIGTQLTHATLDTGLPPLSNQTIDRWSESLLNALQLTVQPCRFPANVVINLSNNPQDLVTSFLNELQLAVPDLLNLLIRFANCQATTTNMSLVSEARQFAVDIFVRLVRLVRLRNHSQTTVRQTLQTLLVHFAGMRDNIASLITQTLFDSPPLQNLFTRPRTEDVNDKDHSNKKRKT